MQFLVDTDGGIDDAVALLMLLGHPNHEVLAITTVVGNVSLAQATHNVGVVLDVGQAPPIPIYRGCARPLLQYSPQDARHVHGDDGLGGLGRQETWRAIETEHASLALIRLIHQYPGQLTLLTLGPLTNIALAIHLDPSILRNLQRFVMMGGAIAGRGNTTPPAEFNIGVDPEAAKVVFEGCARTGLKIELISWEATLAHPISFEDWDDIIAGETPAAKFIQGLTHYIRNRTTSTERDVLLWPDPLAAAVALAPKIVLEQEKRFVAVEAGFNLARGQTIADYRSYSNQPPNTKLICTVDQQKFQELLQLGSHSVKGGGAENF